MSARAAGPVVGAGVLLGCGLGALFDGIVLHQILQWHNMLSTVTPPTSLVAMKYNMLWDGVFHAAAWLTTALGLGLLWRSRDGAARKQGSAPLAGPMLVGWGSFNLVEGLVDHHVLELHHVRPGAGQAAWDVGFLCWGGLMVVIGWGMLKKR